MLSIRDVVLHGASRSLSAILVFHRDWILAQKVADHEYRLTEYVIKDKRK